MYCFYYPLDSDVVEILKSLLIYLSRLVVSKQEPDEYDELDAGNKCEEADKLVIDDGIGNLVDDSGNVIGHDVNGCDIDDVLDKTSQRIQLTARNVRSIIHVSST